MGYERPDIFSEGIRDFFPCVKQAGGAIFGMVSIRSDYDLIFGVLDELENGLWNRVPKETAFEVVGIELEIKPFIHQVFQKINFLEEAVVAFWMCENQRDVFDLGVEEEIGRKIKIDGERKFDEHRAVLDFRTAATGFRLRQRCVRRMTIRRIFEPRKYCQRNLFGLKTFAEFHNQLVSLRQKNGEIFTGAVRCRHEMSDAEIRALAGKLHRLVPILRAVVDTGEDVDMEIYHAGRWLFLGGGRGGVFRIVRFVAWCVEFAVAVTASFSITIAVAITVAITITIAVAILVAIAVTILGVR